MGNFSLLCGLLLLLLVAKDAAGSHHHDVDDDYYQDGRYECTVVRLLSRIKRDEWKQLDFRVTRMRLLKEFHDGTSCRRSNFGYKGREVYAVHGCRGEFEVCNDSGGHRYRPVRYRHHHYRYYRHRRRHHPRRRYYFHHHIHQHHHHDHRGRDRHHRHHIKARHHRRFHHKDKHHHKRW